MKTVFLCEGQGSVDINMGKDLFASNPVYRDGFLEAEDYLQENVQDICWGSSRFKLKTNVKYAHLALFANQFALYRALSSHKVKPDFLMGHSLGEMIALILSGMISPAQGAGFIKKRGQLFQQSAEKQISEMIALIGEETQLKMLIEDLKHHFNVYPANYNTPRQLVISIEKKDQSQIMGKISKEGVKGVCLNLGNGCHSPLISDIDVELRKEIADMVICKPDVPVYSSSFNEFYEHSDDSRLKIQNHLLAPVNWSGSVQRILAENKNIKFINLGSSKVLKGLLLGIDTSAEVSFAAEYLS